MLEIAMNVRNKKSNRFGRVVCISRSDVQCVVAYDNAKDTSGWTEMDQFTEVKTEEKKESGDSA